MLLGVAAAVCVVFFWSGWIVVSRIGVTNHLTVYDVTGLRFSIGAAVALPYIIWRRAWRGLTPKRILVLTLTSGVPYALLSYFGLTYAPAAHGGVFLNGCLPIFTALFGWIWLGQKARFSQIAGLGIILIGVTLVGYEGFVSSGGGMTWLGDVLFLAAIALFAVFMVANRVWTMTPRTGCLCCDHCQRRLLYPDLAAVAGQQSGRRSRIRNSAPGSLSGSGSQRTGHILPQRRRSPYRSPRDFGLSFGRAGRGCPGGHPDPARNAGPAGLDRHDHGHRRHPVGPGYHRPQLI